MKTKLTRRADFLTQMNAMIPCEKILIKLSSHYPKASPPLEVILRIDFLQNGFNDADREFSGISI